MGTEDALGPIQSNATKVFVYEVTVDAPFGKYEGLTAKRTASGESVGRVVRDREVSYSFPENGWKAEIIGERSIEGLRALLSKQGFEDFDAAGSRLGAQALRQAFGFERPEGPQAKRADLEPPPPPGEGARAEPGGPEARQLPRPAGIDGKQAAAYTERGTEVQVQFRAVEAKDLVTSHDDALRQNPDYPQEVQPRARDRAASDAQIASIENNLRPELLGANPKVSDGAPVVGADGVVESGNARTIALRRAYGTGKADKYRAWLLAHAEEFGLERAALEQMEAPVLVRERQTELARAAFAREANEAAVARMSASEVAASDAARMPELDRLVTNEDGTINPQASMAFIRDFVESVPQSERPEMMTAEGALSQAGLNRIRNAVFQRAYGDSDLVAMLAESTDANIKNILAGMMRAAPEVAKLQELIAAGARYPTTFAQDLAKAVRLYSQLRTQGQTVGQFLAQGSMFDSGATRAEVRLLELLEANARAPKRMAEALGEELNLLHGRGNPRQSSLFGDEPGVQVDENVAQAAWLQAQARVAGYPGLDDMVAQDPAAFARLADQWRSRRLGGGAADPVAMAADKVMELHGDALLTVGKNADGTPVTMSARDYLTQARASAEQARKDAGLLKEAGGCALGVS